MKLTTEYLIIIEKKSSEALFQLCDNINDFKKLLQKGLSIIFLKDELKFQNKITVKYSIKSGDVEGKEQRFFYILLSFDGSEDNIDIYVSLLKSIKGGVYNAGGQVETLWDDISFFYSKKSYPLIYKIENLMRKLISYFMLTHVGKEWLEEASPIVIKNAVAKSKRKQYIDILHQIDFIQLGDFLFSHYETQNILDLYEKIDNASSLEELDLEELKGYLSKSNWDRYFSKIVDCTDSHLHKQWKQLYELRCMVAHNSIINKSNYEDVCRISSEIESYLQKAIDNLDSVHVPEEDREIVAENVISKINILYGDFIRKWVSLEKILHVATSNLSPEFKRYSAPLDHLGILVKEGLIDEKISNEVKELMQFRNLVVHGAGTDVTENAIYVYTDKLNAILNTLSSIFKDHPTWKDEVVTALTELGGKAYLYEIYSYIEKHTNRDLSDRWRATVRYTLQLHSSDTETSIRGTEKDLFTRLERGYWGLKGMMEQA